MHHPTDRIIHTTAFVTSVVEHWLEREMALWVHNEESIRRPIAPRSYISLLALPRYRVTYIFVMRSIWITGNIALLLLLLLFFFYPTKVTELHDGCPSLRAAFLRFNTNVDYVYVYVNQTCFLSYLHYHSLSYSVIR